MVMGTPDFTDQDIERAEFGRHPTYSVVRWNTNPTRTHTKARAM